MTPSDGAHLAAAAHRIPSVRSDLADTFRTALRSAFPAVDMEPRVAATSNPAFGDYQCNNAMQLSVRINGQAGVAVTPTDVANAILDALPETSMIAERPTLAGPGFINVKLKPAWIANQIHNMLMQGIGVWAPLLPHKRAVVDFLSSPNAAKEMHVGHLRSTIIGDTLARSLEFCGVDTLRINHVGDWGTQFGMLIEHIADTRNGLTGTTTEEVSHLQKLYKESKARFDADDDFKARARAAVTRLQSGETEYLETWKRICEASRKEFSTIYERLDVRLLWRGESYYNSQLRPLVEHLHNRGTAVESKGALVIVVPNVEEPLMVRKSDGGFLYGTTDMAALKQRIQEEKADWIIYVTDEGQSKHFKQVFGSSKKAGIIPEENPPRIDHVTFGLVLNKDDGKRIRTRDAGNATKLVELLEEAKDRCKAKINEKRTEKEERGETLEPITEEELETTSAIMGYGAVKYADLKKNRKTDYKSNLDEMLSLSGNTAVYILYAHARIASIIKKIGKDVMEVVKTAHIKLEHPAEKALGLQIVKFTDMLEDLFAELAPNRITDHIYELANLFTSFYNECKVSGSAQEDSRLLLCEATAVVMRQCLTLLGIKPLYRI